MSKMEFIKSNETDTGSSAELILPGTIDFEMTLATFSPDWKIDAEKFTSNYGFVADSETGLLRTISGRDCQEYLLGGEYEQRSANMGYGDEEEEADDWGDLSDLDFFCVFD